MITFPYVDPCLCADDPHRKGWRHDYKNITGYAMKHATNVVNTRLVPRVEGNASNDLQETLFVIPA
jgi:hypothetical protein